MKTLFTKLNIGWLLLGAIILLLTACSKEEIIPVIVDEVEHEKVGETPVKIKIVSANLNDSATKAVYDGSQRYFKWENSDQIGVYVAGTSLEANKNANFAFNPVSRIEGGSNVMFEGTLTEPLSTPTLYAYYPYYSASSISSNNITFKFPDVQYYASGGFSGIPAIGSYTGDVDDVSITFKTLATVIKLSVAKDVSLTENPKLQRIEFHSRKSGQNVAGTMSIDPTSVPLAPNCSAMDEGKIELRISSPVEITTSARTFYIAIPSLNYDQGYTFTFYTDQGVFTANAKMPSNDQHAVNTIYITPELKLKDKAYIIEDAAFRRYLHNRGYITSYDENSSVVELINPGGVTEIDLWSHMYYVNSLQGIEYFPNLISLRIGNFNMSEGYYNPTNPKTRITSLDVSNNPKLRVLDCSCAPIKNLDLSNLSSLEVFYGYLMTSLEYLDISGCSQLNDIVLYDDYYSSLVSGDLVLQSRSSYGHNLKVFKANNMGKSSGGEYNIKSIAAYGNDKIEEIYYTNSPGIEAINVQNCPNLRSVDIENSGKDGNGMVVVNAENSSKFKFYPQPAPTDYYMDRAIIYQEPSTVGNGIDLIIMGDGYTRSELTATKYLQDMKSAIESFFSVVPYSNYRNYFNVYVIAAESNESGITKVGTRTINTKFNAVIASSGTGITSDYNMVRSYCKSVTHIGASSGLGSSPIYPNMNNATSILVLNAVDYAGTCYIFPDGFSVAMCPVTPVYFRGTVMHEAGGHGFGRLADEYITHTGGTISSDDRIDLLRWQSYNMYYNVDLTNNTNEILWRDFIGLPKYSMVGAYEGGYYYTYGVWKPEANSCMVNNVDYYNAPSRRIIYERIMTLSGLKYTFQKFLDQDNEIVPKSSSITRSGVDMPPLAPPIIIEDPKSKEMKSLEKSLLRL